MTEHLPSLMGFYEDSEVAPKAISDFSDRARGYVLTPEWLVRFMVELAEPQSSACQVLEPACAEAPFLRAFKEAYGSIHTLWGVDLYAPALQQAIRYLPEAHLIEADFLLWKPPTAFDIVIGNPPYGIIGDQSHYPIHILKARKALYKSLFHTWQGKFNVYGAFIEKSISVASKNAKIVMVVPASWLVLNDFSKLRAYLARTGRISVYYLGKVFPGRSISCVVLLVEKGKQGLLLYERDKLHLEKPIYHGEIIRFETPEILKFEQSGIALKDVFSIYFAARSSEFYRHADVSREYRPNYLPVLTGRNLKAGQIDYTTCYSGLWMAKAAVPTIRSFYGFPHVVMAHTKGIRVVAAVDDKGYPWREEYHLVPKVPHLPLQTLVDYLNSEPVQNYVQTLYRDFVPHLTLPMIERIPLPHSLVPIEYSGKLPL